MSDKHDNALMEKIVSLCKRRGFIFQSSEIYGGINGFWDYGPLGAELKRNVKDTWWNDMVHKREDIAGLDATIIMHPDIWKASGHVGTFSDPMVDCKTCKGRFRADQLEETACPQKPSKCVAECEGEKTEPRDFNLMFKTYVGPVEHEDNIAYLRPETAQAIFAQFKNVDDSSRLKMPFGIAQVGKAFRNEINPRNYTFRSREFEQMEIEFFIRPDEAVQAIAGAVAEVADDSELKEPQKDWGWNAWHRHWFEARLNWYESIGLPGQKLHIRWQTPEERAHYAKETADIEFDFPFGQQELEGIAARGNYDLSKHQACSGKPQVYFDVELQTALKAMDPDEARKLAESYKAARIRYFLAPIKESTPAEEKAEIEAHAEKMTASDIEQVLKGNYIPHVIEPSAGADRLVLALLCSAYDEETVTDAKGKEETRTVMRFSPRVAPIKVGVLPLLKNKPELVAKAKEIKAMLQPLMTVFYDETGAIGRRYRRQDEAGTPFCVTIDFDTLGDGEAPNLKGTVTLRHRDSMEQERIKIEDLVGILAPQVR